MKSVLARCLVFLYLFVIALAITAMPHRYPDEPSTDKITAITDVNVIPMDRNRVMSHQTVLVRNGRISEIGAFGKVIVPRNAIIVEGSGKFLVPGLADMHTHVFANAEYLLYVAQGVTTIRNMWGFPSDLGWRTKIANGEKLGPTIYTAGNIFDGDPPHLRGMTVIVDPADADKAVKVQKDGGYDFIKVYTGLKVPAYDAIVDAAAKHDMRVVGHVPTAVGLEHVLAKKQASIEHLMGYPEAARDADAPSPATWTSDLDAKKVRVLARETQAAGVWNCPTLVVNMKLELSPNEVEAFFKSPEFQLVPPTLKRMSPAPTQDDKPIEPGLRSQRENNRNEIVKALRDAGARLLLGTDTGNPYLVPGVSAHEELALLVNAGLSPYEALRTGTSDAAEFLGALNDFGTIAVGKRADMILLDANPLKNIASINLISGVMVRGRWLPETELTRMLKDQQATYPH